MNLKGIIAISGRPGIFKVITQGKNSVIVESMLDKKRFPAHATEKISTLEDISIFTIDEDVKLVEVLAKEGENVQVGSDLFKLDVDAKGNEIPKISEKIEPEIAPSPIKSDFNPVDSKRNQEPRWKHDENKSEDSKLEKQFVI